ncbi:MAG: putative transcriptional regulator, PucR family [Nocardioides sp.]|jgi:sugar diacid utilization regulator/putative methionine-R-sulfoxide reductase with GAF domain|uniref:helix-turn-helix domain-containing protein n=1 Tax=Nocardioides sp. TaxID=35761 RepID=UPI0026301F81|nr:helix-turn-helix domain-containing protein [Nocardioides sp.]MCW2833447.1 putative transcriptional regulator, PucR family [Nocardioides sp.]
MTERSTIEQALLSELDRLSEAGLDRATILARLADALTRSNGAPVGVHDLLVEHPLPSPGQLLLGSAKDVCVQAGAGMSEASKVMLSTASLALDRLMLSHQIERDMVETGLLRTIATHILAAHSVDEALAAVTHEARTLLGSDIAGVMLVDGDGDEIVMRGCAGNQRVETARLRMRSGQGLAGLVLATGQPERVADYVSSLTISDDFHSLARDEQIRCAMGAPIRVGTRVIGVLEVWRRAATPYTDSDSARLLTLADLAAVAFDNALMHETNAQSLVEIERSHRALAYQYAANDRALHVQQELLVVLLQEPRLCDLLEVIARATHSTVHLLDADREQLGSHPAEADCSGAAEQVKMMTRHHSNASPHTLTWSTGDACRFAIEDITIGDELVGWLCLETDAEPDDPSVSTALKQAAVACALRHLQEQAGARARAQQREELLLELLEGTQESRRAAMLRAKHIHIDLRGSLRVVVVGPKQPTPGLETRDLRRVQRAVTEVLQSHQMSRGLSVVRDKQLFFVTRCPDLERLHLAMIAAHDAAVASQPVVPMAWGVSSECAHALDLNEARVEAETALRMSTIRSSSEVTLYEDLGIVGLFLGSSAEVAMRRFVADTLGSVIEYDAHKGSQLMHTLGTYLDCNCSQSLTAERLFVHQKTVKYRLNLVEKVSGLDLSTHHDRLLADIAVRASQLT